jgi:hypothetical protein
MCGAARTDTQYKWTSFAKTMQNTTHNNNSQRIATTSSTYKKKISNNMAEGSHLTDN